MELLLNILWLSLAVPAIWIWRSTPGPALRCFGRSFPLLLLGCVLVLLFPVVSASDDLHAMRPEAEESSSFSSVQKQSGATKTLSATHSSNHFLTQFVSFSLSRNDEVRGLISSVSTRMPRFAALQQPIARAPPASIRG